MAPLATDPQQLLVVLNLARRKALYQLVSDITASMRSQLQPPGGQDQGPGPSSRGPAANNAPGYAMPSSANDTSDHAGAAVAPPPWPSDPELAQLRHAALAHFDEWRKDVLDRLRQIVSAQEDAKIAEARKQRAVRLAPADAADTPAANLISFDDDDDDGRDGKDDAAAVRSLQAVYRPVPTRLTTIPPVDRREIISCVLLLLLSAGRYSAHSRTLVVYLASSLDLPLASLTAEETEIATTLLASSAEGHMSADDEAQKRRQDGQASRYWKVGLASVAGAAVIGITGGLAAPVVAGAIGGLMGSVGLGGVASFLGIFWMNGALVATLFGAFGAKMTGERMDRYAREVDDFAFLPLKPTSGPSSSSSSNRPSPTDGEAAAAAAAAAAARRLRLTIGINGWLNSDDDVTRPWRGLGDDTDVFALRFEVDTLTELGRSLDGLVSSYAWKAARAELLRRTVLAALWSTIWPVHVLRMAAAVDNPFNRARNRADKAGRLLADALVARVQGERPVALVGYSLGARVVYACLRALAARRAFGLVDTVVLVGAPVPSDRARWLEMRAVVSGPVYNVFSDRDCVLALLYRAASAQLGVAGLQPIPGVPGLENLDLGDRVTGHQRYPDLLPQILTRCGFPDVQGGDRPIEKDADDALPDAPPLDAPTPAPAPPAWPGQADAKPPSGPAAAAAVRGPRRSQTRSVVTRAPPEALAQDLDPLGSQSLAADKVKPLSRPARRPLEGAASWSQPELGTARVPSPPAPPGRAVTAPKGVDEEEQVRRRPVLPQSKTAPPAIVSSFDGHQYGEDDSDDDGGGIKMMDNDEDLV